MWGQMYAYCDLQPCMHSDEGVWYCIIVKTRVDRKQANEKDHKETSDFSWKGNETCSKCKNKIKSLQNKFQITDDLCVRNEILVLLGPIRDLMQTTCIPTYLELLNSYEINMSQEKNTISNPTGLF